MSNLVLFWDPPAPLIRSFATWALYVALESMPAATSRKVWIISLISKSYSVTRRNDRSDRVVLRIPKSASIVRIHYVMSSRVPLGYWKIRESLQYCY